MSSYLDMKRFNDFENLVSLSITSNDITNSTTSMFGKLEYLEIDSGNDILSLFVEKESDEFIPNLKTFVLDNDVTVDTSDLLFLSDMLVSMQLKGLAGNLSGLPKLKSLRSLVVLDSSKIEGDLSSFDDYENLTSLLLFRNKSIYGSTTLSDGEVFDFDNPPITYDERYSNLTYIKQYGSDELGLTLKKNGEMRLESVAATEIDGLIYDSKLYTFSNDKIYFIDDETIGELEVNDNQLISLDNKLGFRFSYFRKGDKFELTNR